MSTWIPARPMQLLEADLKKLGYKEKDIKKLMASPNKEAIRKEATRMIEEKKDKAKEMKSALNKAIPGLNW